jgi:hypothetical protein
MSDVAINAHVSLSGINSGSVVTTASRTGSFATINPTTNGMGVNHFLTSGEMFTKWDERFDSYWYYSGSGAEV